MKSAIVYCRVSTARQEEEGTSLQSQATACTKHAESLGYSVARITQEVYTGAELWDRPKLAQDRADIKAGKCQALIAYATDRLSRDPIHLAIIAEECERAGAELVFVTEPLDSSPEGALIRYVKGYASSIEREKIRERQMRGKRTRLLNGKLHNHGSDLYGYRRDRERGVREVCESEAATVRLIFRWIGEEGLSVRSLVKRLNDTNVPTPSTGKLTFKDGRTPHWGTGALHRILRNPAYKGATIEWRMTGHGGKRNPSERPREEWIELPEGTTPAIVSPALWDAVQARLAANTGDATRNTTHFYLLRGLIYCSVCGQKMRQNMENGTRRVYRCYSRETPSGPCGGKRVPADTVEAEVWDAIAARLQDPSVIAAEVKRRNEAGPDTVLLSDLEAARRMLERLTKQKAGLARRLADAPDDDSLWDLVQREIKRIEAEKQTLADSAADMERRLAANQQAVVQLDSLRAYCERVAARLETFGPEQQRLALDAFGVTILANGRDWEGRGNIPVDGNATGIVSRSSARCDGRLRRSPARA